MRVLCVVPYYKPAYVYGGPVRSNAQLFEALARLGVEVTVLSTNASGAEFLDVPLASPTNVDGVEVFYYPTFPIFPHSFFYSPAQARACHQKAHQYDVAFLDTLFSHAMGPSVAACRKANVPYVVTLRSALLPWGLRHKRLKKTIYRAVMGDSYLNHAAALHCTDAAEMRAVKKLNLRSPAFVVPNGLDTQHFACLPPRGAMRRRLNIPERAHLLLFLGRLHVKKRPDIAVESLVAAQSLSQETHLLLAGPDEMNLTPGLWAHAHSLGCADRLHVTGLLKGDEILSALADADLLLMPSEPESENFGMSAAEALAAGLPILVSEGVPIGPWAESVRAGRVVPCQVEAFRQATCELLSISDELKEMGCRGQVLAREKFDNATVAQQMLEQYQAIVDTGQPLPST
jgi:glycosyltransferase involved in cell wall biosynthesis